MMIFAIFAFFTYPDVSVSPQLPKEQIAEEFFQAKEGFLDRWEAFRKDKKFIPFQKGKSDEILEKEFCQIQEVRHGVWFTNPCEVIREPTEGYDVAKSLLFEDLSRARNCMAFSYNNTTPYYNASTMDIGLFQCIACEGPRVTEVNRFFQMLISYHVTHLVRLTAAKEGDHFKCHSYWEGHLGSDCSILQIPVAPNVYYPVQAYSLEDWKDNQGIDPKRLLDLVLQVKNDVPKKRGILAVHCSAGVGRTGTFLAALSIVVAIDRKIPFSIEEIVYKLSLQRIYSVAQKKQYITLHRLAEEYVKRNNL
ncbi:MAG: tyrosine-protein phosphatase [Chlamydiota bacterium]